MPSKLAKVSELTTETNRALAAEALLQPTQRSEFTALAQSRIRSFMDAGKSINILQIGDSLVAGSGGFRYSYSLESHAQRQYGVGGRGFTSFEINEIGLESALLAGNTTTVVKCSSFNPVSAGWSVQQTGINTGFFAHIPNGVGTYKVGASNQAFYIRDTKRPFNWVRLYYIQHTGSGSIQFGKTGNFTTINCGGAAAVSLQSVTLNIWDGSIADSLFGVIAVSGDVYLAGFETGVHTPSARLHMFAKGAISALTVSGFNAASYQAAIATIKPTICTINLGTNDRGTATEAQLKTYIQTIIDRVKAVDSAIPILLQLPSGTSYRSLYPTALSDLATTNTNTDVFDWESVMGSGVTYLQGDAVHPNEQGCENLCRGIVDSLGLVSQSPESLWAYPIPANLNSIITNPSNDSAFNQATTNWVATAGATVTLDTTNQELDVVTTTGGTYRGASIGSAYYTALVEGGTYYVEIELTRSDSGTLVLSYPGTVLIPESGSRYMGANLTGFTAGGAGIARFIFKGLSANPATLSVHDEADRVSNFSIKRFEVKRLDDVNKKITPTATTGAQTINTLNGSVNFAAAAQTIVVTNSQATVQSGCIATVQTDDTTAKSCIATCAAGAITLKLNAAATAETKVFFSLTP